MTEKIINKVNRMTGKVLAYGIILAACYVYAAFNGGALMSALMSAKWYAGLSVAAVAVALHVAFAMSLYSTLRARAELQRAEKNAVTARKRSAQRARARAYINPWHNI